MNSVDGEIRSFLHLIILTLAAWRLTYEITFGQLCEGLRARLGIGYDYDEEGYVRDRWAIGRVGKLINCHSCVSVLNAILVMLLWCLGAEILCFALAIMAGANLIGRWWMSQRVRKEWWL